MLSHIYCTKLTFLPSSFFPHFNLSSFYMSIVHDNNLYLSLSLSLSLSPPSLTPILSFTHRLKKEASVSPDIQKNLIPYVATLAHSKDRVFKENEVSQTADVEHLQDFEKDVKALLQETLWFLNMHKMSTENEQSIREAVIAVETRMRRVLTIDLSACVSWCMKRQK